MKGFSGLHPAVCFVFFVEVLLLTMIQMHPVLQAVSVGMALATLWALGGLQALRSLKGGLALGMLIAVGNALLNPGGATILFTYLGGRTFTLESLLWGGSAAMLLLAVILWFRSFHLVMTQDKIMFLFGRGIPTLSLLFCMTLRFVPEFTRQLRMLSQARASMGLGLEQCRSGREKIRRGAEQLSAFLSLALEQALVTAASMRGRGYGLPGRKSYALVRMTLGSGGYLAALLLLGGIGLAAILRGGGGASYFPSVQLAGGRMLWLGAAAEGLLMAMPVLCNAAVQLRWRRSRR